MKSGWTKVAIGDVAKIERAGVDPQALPLETRYIGLEHIERGGRLLQGSTIGAAGVSSTKFSFTPDHVLVGKLRPNLAKITVAPYPGVSSTDILPVLPGPNLSKRYLAHYLLRPKVTRDLASLASGANLPRLSPKVLEAYDILLPPLDEQRRIAAVLDHVDALRAKRRRSVDLCTQAERSLFDASVSTGSVERTVLKDVLVDGLANGLSPSNSGTIPGRVLTLSAVTGGAYDPSVAKDATFEKAPTAKQIVQKDSFLISRGNGNPDLVGVAVLVGDTVGELIFPDTVIGGKIRTDRVDPSFVATAWRSQRVRAQIRAISRTTNGTYKVNQKGLESIEFVVPDRDVQNEFATKLASLDSARASALRHLAELDTLFASLQSRAFSGDLDVSKGVLPSS